MPLGFLLPLGSFALLPLLFRGALGFSHFGGAPLLQRSLCFGLGQLLGQLPLLCCFGGIASLAFTARCPFAGGSRFVIRKGLATLGISCGPGLPDKQRYRIGPSPFVSFYLRESLAN